MRIKGSEQSTRFVAAAYHPCKVGSALSIRITRDLIPCDVERSSISLQSASVKVKKLNSDGSSLSAICMSRFSNLKNLLFEQLGQYGLSQPDLVPKQDGNLRDSMVRVRPGIPL